MELADAESQPETVGRFAASDRRATNYSLGHGDSGNHDAGATGQHPTPAVARTPRIGDEFILQDGVDAVVVHCDKDTVWLRTSKGRASYGTSAHVRRDLDASLAERRIAFADRSAAATDPQPERQTNTAPGLTVLPPPSPTAGLTAGIQAWWAKLATWAKAAVIAVPTLLILILAVTTATGGTSGRDWESYNWGYNKGTQGWTQTMANYSQGEACRSILKLFYELPGGEGIDHGDAMEGCMDAVKKYPRRTN